MWFTLWLVCSLARTAFLALGTDGPSSWAYNAAWRATEPILLLLLIAAVLEAYVQRCAEYRALGRVGGLVLAIALSIALLAAASVSSTWQLSGWPTLRAVFLFRRASLISLAVVCGATLAFFWACRIPAAPNRAIHHAILTSYVGLHALSLVPPGQALQQVLHNAASVATTGCFLAWCWLLRPAGEIAPAMPSQVLAARAERGAAQFLKRLVAARGKE